jgi:hypothetical protein
VKTAKILLPLLLLSGVYGDEKAFIDTIVKNILEPRHIQQAPIKKSPFVVGKRSRPKSAVPAKKRQMPRLELQGVFNKKALINDRLYTVGNTVKGYQIQTISEEGVTFLKNGILYAAKLAAGGSKIQIKRDR